jgi:hypothetical protein
MKSFILFLALVCGGVSFLLYTDNQFVSGNWAGRSVGAQARFAITRNC